MELDKDSLFDIKNRWIGGTIKEGLISSHDFIRQGVKVIEQNKGLDTLQNLVHEYSMILKYIIKQEMMYEMQKAIKSVDTFYN